MSSQATKQAKAGDLEALLYPEKNFGGTPESYTPMTGVDCYPRSITDDYLSLDIGKLVKVILYRIDGTVTYMELFESTADLSDLSLYQMALVRTHDTRVIAFNFKDETGGASKQYSLTLKAADVGERILYSNENEELKLVGTMPEGGPPVVTAVYIRDQNSGVYIATGSIFFQWNSTLKQVDIISNENFPKQLKQERSGASSFVITLISDQPT